MDNKKTDVDLLLEMNGIFEDSKSTKKLDDFSENEQTMIIYIMNIMGKHCRTLSLINGLFIFIKLEKLVSVILFALLIIKVFPFYIAVIISLLLWPILEIIFRKILYSTYNKHKKYEILVKSLGLSLNDIIDMIEE